MAIISNSAHCGICRRPFTTRDYMTRGAIHVDHVQPLSAGGSDSPMNLQAAHRHCNLAKGPKAPPSVYVRWL